jgi:hypothetical protein
MSFRNFGSSGKSAPLDDGIAIGLKKRKKFLFCENEIT